jgi:hypothetical protein
VQAREFTGATRAPKGDVGSQKSHKKGRGATAVDRKREVVVVPVSAVKGIEVFSRVLGPPTDIDGGRQLISRK